MSRATLERLKARLDDWTRWTAFLGFIGLLVVSAAVMVDVLLRWLFSAPIHGVEDITRLVFVIVIACCFPAGLMRGTNIVIRFLGKGLGARGEHWLEVFGAALTLVFFTLVAWQLVIYVFDLRASGDTTMVTRAVMWPWWAVASVILVFCLPVQLLVLAGHVVRAILGGGPGGTVDEGEDVHAAAGRVDTGIRSV